MLRAVIFDMDGVLIDSEPYHYKVESIIFRKLNISITEKERHTFIGKAGDKIWEHIRKKYQLGMSVPELLAYDRGIRTEYMASITDIAPISGIPELISSLKNNDVAIALASSSSMEIIQILMRKAGLIDVFDYLVSGDSVENGKPSPDIFLHSAEVLNTDTSDCIVIEDSHNGVKAAKAASMICVGYSSPGTRGQNLAMADIVVDDFHTLDFERLSALMPG